MTDGNLSRRKLLGGVVLATAAAATVQTAAAADKVCADVSKMDADKKGLREALNYKEKADDAKMSCSTCGFFTAGSDGCGTCMIFTGPANPMGHCDSWAAKG
jgi:hypothetical protein